MHSHLHKGEQISLFMSASPVQIGGHRGITLFVRVTAKDCSSISPWQMIQKPWLDLGDSMINVYHVKTGSAIVEELWSNKRAKPLLWRVCLGTPTGRVRCLYSCYSNCLRRYSWEPMTQWHRAKTHPEELLAAKWLSLTHFCPPKSPLTMYAIDKSNLDSRSCLDFLE